MATHLKIVLLACLLSLMVFMEEVKPVLGRGRSGLRQRTKMLEESVSELKEKIKEQDEKMKEQDEKMKEQDEIIKEQGEAIKECNACLKIEQLNKTISELQEQTGQIQDPNKPSAHIEAANIKATIYQANTVIKDWSVNAPYSHLAGGMTYNDGKLTVPTRGRYYIYAQLYYTTGGRVRILVNNKIISMIHPPGSANQGSLYAGVVLNLEAGDTINLTARFPITVFMYSFHSYFGAFLI